MIGRTGYGIIRHPPPPGPDDLIDRELAPQVAHRDDVVEPGVRHEDHVGVRAGGDGGERPAGARGEQVGHIPGPFGQIRAAQVLQPLDPPAPPARGPVPALREDDQRTPLVEPAGQPRDLLVKICSPAWRDLIQTFGRRLPTTSTLGSSWSAAFITTRGRRW